MEIPCLAQNYIVFNETFQNVIIFIGVNLCNHFFPGTLRKFVHLAPLLLFTGDDKYVQL